MAKEKFMKTGKELSKAWDEARKVKDDVAQSFEPEDGRYVVALVMAEVGQSQASGRNQITWEYLFLDTDYKGKTFRSWDGLDRPEGLPYVMKRIEALGYDVPESPDELEGLMEQITKDKPKIRIIIKTKGEFRNVYVVKAVEEDDLPEGWEEALGESSNGRKPAKTPVTKEKPETTSVAEVESTDDQELEIEKGTSVKIPEGVGEIVAIDEESQEVVVKVNGKKFVASFNDLEKAPAEEKPASGKVKIKK
jgi:hypothetical protein